MCDPNQVCLLQTSLGFTMWLSFFRLEYGAKRNCANERVQKKLKVYFNNMLIFYFRNYSFPQIFLHKIDY